MMCRLGDTDRIEELTVGFIVKYGEEDVSIGWNESMNIPERIRIYSTKSFVIRYHPEIPSSWEVNPTVVELWANSYKSEYMEKAKEFSLSFLSGNSQFLGIDINELEFSKTDVGSKNTYAKVIYNQVYKGAPVDDGDLYVIVDSEENPSGRFRMVMNSSDYYPCIDVDVVPNVSMEEAESVVLEDRGVTELFNVVKIPVGNNSIFYEYVSHLDNTTYNSMNSRASGLWSWDSDSPWGDSEPQLYSPSYTLNSLNHYIANYGSSYPPGDYGPPSGYPAGYQPQLILPSWPPLSTYAYSLPGVVTVGPYGTIIGNNLMQTNLFN